MRGERPGPRVDIRRTEVVAAARRECYVITLPTVKRILTDDFQFTAATRERNCIKHRRSHRENARTVALIARDLHETPRVRIFLILSNGHNGGCRRAGRAHTAPRERPCSGRSYRGLIKDIL